MGKIGMEMIYLRNWWAMTACYFIYDNQIPPMELAIYLELDKEILIG
jgi:hypothetical protein